MSPAHVLVTGASGAIGSACARALRQRYPEARLTLLDVSPSVEALAQSLGASARVADLSDTRALPALLEEISRDGLVDGLVNAAGVMQVRRLETLPWADAERLMQIDLMAPLLLLQAVAGRLREAERGGFIVNVTSMAGRVPLKGCAFYGAAKAGLSMASEIAREELAPHGIRVLTVYPGPVASDLERGARAQYEPAALPSLLPVGDPALLAEQIVARIDRGGRLVYPRLYEVAYAGRAIERFTLGFGPRPSG